MTGKRCKICGSTLGFIDAMGYCSHCYPYDAATDLFKQNLELALAGKKWRKGKMPGMLRGKIAK